VITVGNAKRAIAVGKILIPVLMPVLMRVISILRGAWDDWQARRLGVPVSELGRYSGKGGALHARISRLATSMRELAASTNSGPRAAQVNQFVTTAEPKLADMSAAVRAAELMPTVRRRAAHRAVAHELDQMEPELLRLLGVSPGGVSVGVSSDNGVARA